MCGWKGGCGWMEGRVWVGRGEGVQLIVLNLPDDRQQTLVLSKQYSTGFSGFPVLLLSNCNWQI